MIANLTWLPSNIRGVFSTPLLTTIIDVRWPHVSLASHLMDAVASLSGDVSLVTFSSTPGLVSKASTDVVMVVEPLGPISTVKNVLFQWEHKLVGKYINKVNDHYLKLTMEWWSKLSGTISIHSFSYPWSGLLWLIFRYVHIDYKLYV